MLNNDVRATGEDNVKIANFLRKRTSVWVED